MTPGTQPQMARAMLLSVLHRPTPISPLETQILVQVQSCGGRGKAPVPFVGLREPRGPGDVSPPHRPMLGQHRGCWIYPCGFQRACQASEGPAHVGGWEKPRRACPLAPWYFTEGRSIATSSSEPGWDVCALEVTGEAMSPTARESLILEDLCHQGLQNSKSGERGPSHPFLSL